MPRIGTTPEEQSSGGGSSFDFAEGRGRVIACRVFNHQIQSYTINCGYGVTIQRLDANWKPTGDEPQEEFLGAGAAEVVQWDSGGESPAKFHPAKASGPDDDFGGAEPWGNKKFDQGGEVEAEGNCLIVNPEWGKGPDKKSKLSVFSNSLIEHGVSRKFFNGFAPNLVGLEAHFSRFMMEKPKNSKAANDPTALIIGKGGLVKGGETKDLVHKYPDAQTEGKSAPVVARSTPAPPANKKLNGVDTAEQQPEAPNTVGAQTRQLQDEAAAGTVDEQVETTAIQMLTAIGGLSKGQTITRAKLGSRLTVQLAQHNVDTKLHPKVKALVATGKDSEGADWLAETVAGMGWTVAPDGQAVTTPAA